MTEQLYLAYVSILKNELIPALGCTEPIAIAYTAAKAKEVLDCEISSIKVECSGNIIKNVQGVVVPNSGGKKGVAIAAILGAVGGKSSDGLEVLSKIKPLDIEKACKLRELDSFCECSHVVGKSNLFIKITVFSKDLKHSAIVIVSDTHTNIVYIEKDGATLFSKQDNEAVASKSIIGDYKALLTVKDIYNFANVVKIEDVKEVIERQITYNTAISQEGLKNNWGAQVGKTLATQYDFKDIKVRAKAVAAAGSDARMSGCAMPVVINSGSGNQGMTVSLPVIEYAKELKSTQDVLIRALVLSNLIALLQKRYIGSLSAFCGAVCAGAGAGAGITYLHGGSAEDIARTITNTLAAVGGIVCDGAKPSCAAKIASSIDAAIMGFEMSFKCKKCFSAGDGLVKSDIEETVKSFGRLGKEGMKTTDEEILKIMLEK